jgi:hypothetical protein
MASKLDDSILHSDLTYALTPEQVRANESMRLLTKEIRNQIETPGALSCGSYKALLGRASPFLSLDSPALFDARQSLAAALVAFRLKLSKELDAARREKALPRLDEKRDSTEAPLPGAVNGGSASQESKSS